MLYKNIRLLVLIISVATVLSGLVQMIAPGFVLDFVGAQITPTTSHFFGIVGMFMTLFGCLMVNTIYNVTPTPATVLWCALQKLGASIAVFLGIIHRIFSIPAAGVAIFDLCSGILFFYYIKFLKTDEAR
jgi:hypothetical protein